MARTFAYVRVSQTDLTTENQIQEIEAHGFAIEPRRIISETVSGATAIGQRQEFLKLMDRLEAGDILVVTKLDRLGRNSIDVQTTVEKLEALGVRVHCLALGGADLTSSTGKLTMGVIAAVAQFERDLIIERTAAGCARARKAGKRFGRPPALTKAQCEKARAQLEQGASVSSVARQFGTSRMTIMRTREAA
jgi:putative DNA-invertase from lambdoid prophage Rac